MRFLSRDLSQAVPIIICQGRGRGCRRGSDSGPGIICWGGVGGSVYGAASTGLSLRMSQDLSIGDVGTATVGERLAPGLSVRGVGGRVMREDVPSVWLTPELSVRAANGRAGRIFYPVSQRFRVLVVRLICQAAAAAHFTFEGDAFLPPE